MVPSTARSLLHNWRQSIFEQDKRPNSQTQAFLMSSTLKRDREEEPVESAPATKKLKESKVESEEKKVEKYIPPCLVLGPNSVTNERLLDVDFILGTTS
jgi:hypothetical protein